MRPFPVLPALALSVALSAALASQWAPDQRPPAPAPPAPAPPRAEAVVPFRAGERLLYDVSWSRIRAGTATVSVLQKKPSYGSVAYYLVAEGGPSALLAAVYPLYYKADSLLDVYDLLPQRASIFSRESGRQQFKETLFDQSRHTARYTVAATGTRQTLRLPPGTHDALSVIFWLRTIDLRPGMKITVPVCYNGSVVRVQVNVGNRETAGNRPAWRITPVVIEDSGKVSPRRMTVWVSDDVQRLPVRMEVELAVGSFVLTLK